MIEIKDITKVYRTRNEELKVLDGVSARFEKGSFSAICGPSGCGKSTLLLILGALLSPDDGSVTVNGENLLQMPPEKRAARRASNIGFVFQRFHLVPYLTVEENIYCAGVALGKRDDASKAGQLMNDLKINDRRGHVPGRLSVGEQQRTALARALYNEPAVMLADEPTGNLDPDNSQIVLNAFADFARSGGTVVMVTHHPDAARMADDIWSIKDGRIEKE